MISYALSFVALGIMILWIALMYALGHYLNRPDYIALSQHELIQWIFSVALLLAMMGMPGFIMMIFNESGFSDPIDYVLKYLIGLRKDIIISYISLHRQMFSLKMLGNLVLAWGGSTKGMAFSPFASIGDMLRVIGTLDFLLFFFLTSIEMQIMIISLLPSLTFEILFPVAVLFRIFPPTRRAAASIFGLTVALYVAFPLLFAGLIRITEDAFQNSGLLDTLLDEGKQISAINAVKSFCRMTNDIFGASRDKKIQGLGYLLCSMVAIGAEMPLGTTVVLGFHKLAEGFIGADAAAFVALFSHLSNMSLFFIPFIIMMSIYLAKVFAEGLVIFSLLSLLFPTVARAVASYVEGIFV